MKVLGIETSTPQGSIAISEDGNLLSEIIWNSLKGHLSILPKAIEFLFETQNLGMNDIDLVAVSIGPGSFTGLRVGLATAKGICISFQKPIKGVSSLKVLASEIYNSERIYPVIDAKRGLIYAGCYRWENDELVEIMKDELFAPEEFIKRVSEGILIGDGAKRYKDLFSKYKIKIFEYFDYPYAHNLCRLAQKEFTLKGGDDLQTLEPHYIKPSEAEMKNP